MELHTIRYENKDIVVLLDDDMKLVKPVYDYLKYLRQKDRAFNTIKANCNDLKLYWDFLNKEHYQYKLIKQEEPQIGFIILTYRDGTVEVLFNWDFREIPQDPVVLLSRDQEIISMFSAQYKGLWRVAVEDYDNIATKSTSKK